MNRDSYVRALAADVSPMFSIKKVALKRPLYLLDKKTFFKSAVFGNWFFNSSQVY